MSDIVYMTDEKRLVEVITREESGDIVARNVTTENVTPIYIHELGMWRVLDQEKINAAA